MAVPKRENIDFDKLDKVFSGESQDKFSEEDLLNIVRNPEIIRGKGLGEQLTTIAALQGRMAGSEEFKKKVVEIIEERAKSQNDSQE